MKDDKDLIKLRCTDKEEEVYHYKDYLCSFGWNDLFIDNDCNINYKSWSDLGNC